MDATSPVAPVAKLCLVSGTFVWGSFGPPALRHSACLSERSFSSCETLGCLTCLSLRKVCFLFGAWHKVVATSFRHVSAFAN